MLQRTLESCLISLLVLTEREAASVLIDQLGDIKQKMRNTSCNLERLKLLEPERLIGKHPYTLPLRVWYFDCAAVGILPTQQRAKN